MLKKMVNLYYVLDEISIFFESITRNLHNKSHTLIKGKREQKENVK